ncbi:MAG: hypothetical protein M4579_006975 [Chaenotheca gracillima]|nr:MAG: hypothetical protein M4579_006975 [Chaenotheca gracillima]
MSSYDLINTFFEQWKTQAVELEILPQTQGAEVLRDGASMGVGKMTLAGAFIEARQVFWGSQRAPNLQSEALEATRVLLFLHPEHLTAANYRKKSLIVAQRLAKEEKLSLEGRLTSELSLLESFLTSPLHRHSKSPTLWNHRRFVMQVFLIQGLIIDIQALWRFELAIVMKAGEQHPQNYYAWNLMGTQHWALCFMLLSVVTSMLLGDHEALQALRGRSPALIDCLMSKNITISIPTSSDFTQLSKPFNLRLPYVPAAITLPTTYHQVSDSVHCACESGTKVQAKSGGHSYASFSSGGKNDSLIIDLEKFQQISVDSSSYIATVGGGVRLGNLAEGIYNHSQRALPHGSCPGVGVGGHFTHGGYGYDARSWGLALDTIVGLDIVLANGSYIHATNTSYPEIYYGMRGAADSLGIITTFYLQTVEAPESVVNFHIDLPAVLNSKEAAADYFLDVQEMAQNASIVDRNLGFNLWTDGTDFVFQGAYMGSYSKFTNDILPDLLRPFPTPRSEDIQELGWLDSLANMAGGALAQPLTNYNAHDTFYAKSIVTQQSRPLERESLESFFGFMISNKSNFTFPWFTTIDLWGGADSQINTVPVSASAFSQRSTLWLIQSYASVALPPPAEESPDEPPAASLISLVADMTDSLTSVQPDGNFSAYPNYVDPNLTAAEAHQSYYGEETYERLAALKTAIDPEGLFWNPQAIGVKG